MYIFVLKVHRYLKAKNSITLLVKLLYEQSFTSLFYLCCQGIDGSRSSARAEVIELIPKYDIRVLCAIFDARVMDNGGGNISNRSKKLCLRMDFAWASKTSVLIPTVYYSASHVISRIFSPIR